MPIRASVCCSFNLMTIFKWHFPNGCTQMLIRVTDFYHSSKFTKGKVVTCIFCMYKKGDSHREWIGTSKTVKLWNAYLHHYAHGFLWTRFVPFISVSLCFCISLVTSWQTARWKRLPFLVHTFFSSNVATYAEYHGTQQIGCCYAMQNIYLACPSHKFLIPFPSHKECNFICAMPNRKINDFAFLHKSKNASTFLLM